MLRLMLESETDPILMLMVRIIIMLMPGTDPMLMLMLCLCLRRGLNLRYAMLCAGN